MGDVEGEAVAVQFLHHRLQLAGGLRDVDAEDRRTVAVQDAGDLLADAAARAGDDGQLAGQRTLPVLELDCLLLAVGADPDDLAADVGRLGGQKEGERGVGRLLGRSEEHTSELQSLMRISYAVFCLKKQSSTRTPHTALHN